jgi:hypothetical protein
MPADSNVSALIANNPASDGRTPELVRKEVEDKIKAELLKDLSLEDVRNMIQMVKSGIKPQAGPTEYPDEFDEHGRNFRRMVHKMEMVGSSGDTYFVERPMALSLEDARKMRPPGDYFDIDEKVWILRGAKRQRDYPENTVEGFMSTVSV